MKSMYKIAVLGIGGVGGYIGGKLAARYTNSNELNITFIARGENLNAIKSKGLKLVTDENEIIVFPNLVTHQPVCADAFNLVICCVKGYDLESGLEGIKNCIDSKTIILPLLNGISATEIIKKMLPQANVCQGCIYIVSKLTEPGAVKMSGTICDVYFGSSNSVVEGLKQVENIFKSANINASFVDDIEKVVWEKFIFISSLATLTSYLDNNIGKIKSNPHQVDNLRNLITEVKNVAEAKGISLTNDIVQRTLDKALSLPDEHTTSMHRDFKKGGKTELESLTSYVVKLGKELNVPTLCYEKMLASLSERSRLLNADA